LTFQLVQEKQRREQHLDLQQRLRAELSNEACQQFQKQSLPILYRVIRNDTTAALLGFNGEEDD